MTVKVMVHLLGLGLREVQRMNLPSSPNVGDWIYVNDDADGMFGEVVKVLYLGKGAVDVIVELIGPADTIKTILSKVSHREELGADNIKKFVSQELNH
ncbi:hypothetical protein [Cloacibacillus porcorum]|uniref:Uncharacterized protein n=1 Tax=Cloacibacillus porcorum TaxID=1197717 RepID=A0A1B2I678_9BACT|nr:hypothetical protein [Cloacibacillus porcorum]ANZ45479.1 hypothetical protein BED41_10610 [Cloacibacillus porcorum]